ncbi:MAG: lipoyl(octanoyl) transferase LipB [Leptospiraceae bacterium]|nr:lipoyl(octanoyl) transferase LipB [Leptospiraceae bacterium]MCP5511630.1 lipoyl(octanoyl) transferase LipB [Leptospiraceae bacterium]
MKTLICHSPVLYSRYLEFQEKSRTKRKESLIFLEHPATITSGTSANEENLLVSLSQLERQKISFLKVNRGGDFTAHEPGQLVIYPHLDLKKRNLSVTDYIGIFRNSLSFSIQKTWGLEVSDNPEKPGLYVSTPYEKKLVSFGITFKSFFTSFGAGFNISNSLETFQYIHPCGGQAGDMISISSLKLEPGLKDRFIQKFIQEFFKKLESKG